MYNKKMKRIIRILTFAMICMLMVSCGKPAGSNKTSGSSSSAENKTQASLPEASTISKMEESSQPMTSKEDPSQQETGLSKSDLAFIGDSRTLSLASGGKLAYELVDSAQIFATWGGELTEDTAINNTKAAALAMKKCGIFWYGINDIQEDRNKQEPLNIISDYEELLNTYRTINPDSQIIILSIITTSKSEKDYYEGQEANIAKVNQGLSELAKRFGGRYIDITDLFSSENDLAEDDQIHFSKAWYVNKFLPRVYGEVL